MTRIAIAFALLLSGGIAQAEVKELRQNVAGMH
jgi:hypothetical protein